MSTELAGNPETVEEPGVVKRAKGIVSRTGFEGFTTRASQPHPQPPRIAILL
jgi:hypothetical protein